MPVIPADFQVNRSPFAGVPEAQAQPGAFAAPGQAQAQAGREISAEAERWQQQYGEAIRQKTAADLSYGGMTELAASQEKWSRVPDAQQAIAGFTQEAQQIHQKYAGMSLDPMVQSEVLRQLNGHTIWAQMNVQNRSFAAESNLERAKVDERLDGYAQQAAQTNDPMVRSSIADAAISSIDGAVKAGWIYPEQGELRKEHVRDAIFGEGLRQDLRNNPRDALRALSAGEYDRRISAAKMEQLQPAIERAQMAVGAADVGSRHGFGTSTGAVSGGFGRGPATPVADALPTIQRYENRAGDPNLGVGGTDLTNAPHDETGFPQWNGQRQPDGSISHAAGLYQFEPDTWRRYAVPLGIHDFSPESQRRVAEAAYNAEGWAPWAPYNRQLAGAIGYGGGGLRVAAGVPITAQDGTQAPPYLKRPDIEGAESDINQMIQSGQVTEKVGEGMIADLKRQFQVQQSITHGARADALRDMKDATAAAADGQDVDPPLQRAKDLLAPDVYEDQLNKYTEAAQAGQAKNAVRWASPEETQATLDEAQRQLQPDKPGGVVPDYAKRALRLRALNAEVAAKNTALDNNPAAYVRDELTVAMAYQEGASESAIAASLDEQQREGVPEEKRRTLTNQEAGDLARDIASKDPGDIDMTQELQSYARVYGRFWNKALGEAVTIGKLPPQYQVLATMDQPQQAAARAAYQAMLRATRGEKGFADLKRVTPDMDSEFQTNIESTMRKFDVTMPSTSVQAMMRDSVENLARWYNSGGENVSKALTRAYDDLIGNRWDFDGRLRVPKDANGNSQLSEVTTAARGLQDAIKPEQLPPAPGAEKLTPEQQREVTQDAVQHGFWMTNESGDGAQLMLNYEGWGIAKARYADGRPITFKFADAKQMNAKAPPSMGAFGAAAATEGPGTIVPGNEQDQPGYQMPGLASTLPANPDMGPAGARMPGQR